MSTNQPYVARSMNGIISIDDGAGGTMEDGVVTCNDLETPRISVDQIQSKTVGANVSLFTELVGGSVHLANGATTLFVDAPTTIVTTNVTNLNATNISTNNIDSAVPSTTVNLFNNQTTGLINFATGRTSGTVNLGSNTATGSFNIRNGGVTNIGAFSSSLTLGTSQTVLQTVTIGNLGITNVKGSELNVFADMYVDKINASTSSSTANLFTNVSTGILNIGTQMHTLGTINIGKQSEINFSNSTLNIAGGANVSNLFCNNFRHEVYGPNVSLLLEEFGSGATIQMGNVSNPLIIYAPTTIVYALKAQTIISPNPTILSELFGNNTSGNVSIATGLTTGVLTLGSAGVVNIKGSSVNISTLNTSTFNVSTINTNTITATNTSSFGVIFNNITTGQIRIGNNASFTEIGANATVIELGKNAGRVEVCNLRMSGSEIRTKDFASVLTIGGANMSTTQIVAVGTSQENVYLGAVTATANTYVGDFKFNNNTMNLMVGSAPNVSGTMQIGNALTVGSLQLGTGLTTGNVSIGNGTMTGNINLRTTGALLLANSASSIELGTGASVTNNINLGNVSTSINVVGSAINIGNTSPNTIVIGNDTTSANSLILRTLGTISVGLKSFAVNIGTGAVTNTVALGNASSTINALGLDINTSSNNINVVSPVINIGANIQTNVITIGNVSTASLTLNTPINPNYDTKYTAGVAEGGAPGGCIGNYKFVSSGASGALTSGLAKSVGIFTDLPIGVWLLYFTMDISCPTTASAITVLSMWMGTSAAGSDILSDIVECANFTLAVGRNKSYSRFQIYSNLLATTDVHLTVFGTFTGTLTLNGYTIKEIKALRLA
jgi:hypothetical protein